MISPGVVERNHKRQRSGTMKFRSQKGELWTSPGGTCRSVNFMNRDELVFVLRLSTTISSYGLRFLPLPALELVAGCDPVIGVLFCFVVSSTV